MAGKEAFAAECIGLFSQLWAQLEAVAIGAPVQGPVKSTWEPQVETVRLELIVLLDACRAARWRMLLDGEQRQALEGCLAAVLDCLNTRFEEAPLQAVERAQNRLLDAVLEHHREPQHTLVVGRSVQRARA